MKVLEALIELDHLKGWTTVSELASVAEEKKLRVTQVLNQNKDFVKSEFQLQDFWEESNDELSSQIGV